MRVKLMSVLPITHILESLDNALCQRGLAVLIAPPGAGKTTCVPLYLMNRPYLDSRMIIMLEPRRLAAKAAAKRMADQLGEAVGERIGFQIRGEVKRSALTQVLIVTEGIFSRMILADPDLPEIGMVIFDEFHERSLDADLGLAFAMESRDTVRDDLRICIMSATMEGEKLSTLLDNAPLIVSQGRQFPVETSYCGRNGQLSLEEDMASHCLRLSHQLSLGNSLLAFLPGQKEILRTKEKLLDKGLSDYIDLLCLYGAMGTSEQDELLKACPKERSRIILATNIAETSLTLDGVSVVLDSGWERRGRYDVQKSVVILEDRRISLASADQRQGRAGRQGPGRCYRLWDEANNRAMEAFSLPEILEADLSSMLLSLKAWGVKDLTTLRLLDFPPKSSIEAAEAELRLLGIIDSKGTITPKGKIVHSLPLGVRLANLVYEAEQKGEGKNGAALAMILMEPQRLGQGIDLELRLDHFWRSHLGIFSQRRAMAKDLMDEVKSKIINARLDLSPKKKPSIGGLIALAFPDFIAAKIDTSDNNHLMSDQALFLMRNSRQARIMALRHEGDAQFLKPGLIAIADLTAVGRYDRINLAARIDRTEIETLFANEIEIDEIWQTKGQVERAYEVERLGALILRERPLSKPSAALIKEKWALNLRQNGWKALPIDEAWLSFLARARYVAESFGLDADLSENALLGDIDHWLLSFCESEDLHKLNASMLMAGLKGYLGYEFAHKIETEAPSHWMSPLGNRYLIDYSHYGGPLVSVRVQECFGLKDHPHIGTQKTPLVLSLLSPAHRPIQLTKDLVAFWGGSWADVKKDMRGRYPRHVWPDDPMQAVATLKAKPRSH
jgi:ATP-dependent helicase HrpB